jgi:hypothetical protein
MLLADPDMKFIFAQIRLDAEIDRASSELKSAGAQIASIKTRTCRA